MNQSAKEIWEATLGGLELQVTKSNYQTWLKDTVGLAFENDQFVIGAPSTFTVEWLDKRLRHLITKSLSGVIGRPVEVEFQVGQELKAKGRKVWRFSSSVA